MNSAAVRASLPPSIAHFTRHISRWLERDDIIEISINRPGQLFVEQLGSGHMQEHDVPDITEDVIRSMAQQIAAYSRQAVNEQLPLLSATMPGGERFQAVLPPAAHSGGAINIRRQVIQHLTLTELERGGAFEGAGASVDGELDDLDRELARLLHDGRILDFLELAVSERKTIVVSGGTSSGKTTFVNALIAAVPAHERIILLEDTRELRPPHRNCVELLASKGGQGQAAVTMQSLLEACLRMRPDRLFPGELRGNEAFSFLRAVNTGHPGSITTVHADSPLGAIEQLVLMTLQSGVQLAKDDLVRYIRSVVPIIVQMRRSGERRGVREIYFDKYDLWLRRCKS